MNFRKKFLLGLAVLLFGLTVYGYFQALPGMKEETENLPKIDVTPSSFDFGQVSYGQILTQRFEVKNSGEAALEIKRVSTSCGCTTAKISQEKIGPGEKAELSVTYDTGAMGGAHGKGEQERIIYLRSNDPQNSQTEVVITANVK